MLELIVVQSFQLIENNAFRALLYYQRPQMKKDDVPHESKLKEEIMAKALDMEQMLKEHFAVCVSDLESFSELTSCIECPRADFTDL